MERNWSRACSVGVAFGRRWEVMLDSDWLFGPVGCAGMRSCTLIGCSGSARISSHPRVRQQRSPASRHTHTHTYTESPEITLPGEFPSLVGREEGLSSTSSKWRVEVLMKDGIFLCRIIIITIIIIIIITPNLLCARRRDG